MTATLYPCPACDGTLELDRKRPGEPWVCNACGGSALGAKGAGKAVHAEFGDLLRRAVKRGGRRGPRRCGLCRMHMYPFTAVLGDARIHLDACDHCRRVWFDPGELEAAKGLLPPPPRGKHDRPLDSHLSWAKPAKYRGRDPGDMTANDALVLEIVTQALWIWGRPIATE